ncbi:uncharacterized protein LTR77_002535 [Saxophila tyrrhenica]|uniref:Methyltransferase domain-containing protein n=1 Tax=Saxophila tyrrhenica TaxID=1690608 RepID=A0AAV9PJJ4_9PEZI|nr:hypothetical protein LTR77_002535 [Saxophila tyrrhenica]
MPSKDIYALAREPTETERLNAQNLFLIDCVGYILHHTILSRLPPAARICDLATGTGAFLASLSKELPSNTQLDGIDYSDAAFMPEEQLPKNVRMTVGDAKVPGTNEETGLYDVVCIRFINAAMVPEDWAKVAERAAAMLKPGGALQWIEADLLQLATVLRTHPKASTVATEQATARAMSSTPHASWFVTNLASVLENAGFSQVRRYVSSTDRDVEGRLWMTKIAIGAQYALLRQQVMSGAEGALTAEQVEEAKEAMEREAEGGMYLRADMHTFVAWRK